MKDLDYFSLLLSLSDATQGIVNLLNRTSVLMKEIIGKILIVRGAALEGSHSIKRVRALDSLAQILTLLLTSWMPTGKILKLSVPVSSSVK